MALYFLTIFLALSSLIAIKLVFDLISKNRQIQELESQKLISEERGRNSAEKLQDYSQKIQFLEEQNSSWSIYKGRFDQAEIIIADLKTQYQNVLGNNEFLSQKLATFSQDNELLKQKQEMLQAEQQQWNINKEALLHSLSAELMRKNNEEHHKLSQNQQENIKQVTENLFKNFEAVLNKVSSLNDDVKKTGAEVSLTKNALLNPGGAGRTAEITLENILRASGLREKLSANEGGDFMLQAHFADQNRGSKRPDALVFMPNNHIVIIDSKSSSHFLDLQQTIDDKNPALEKELNLKIKESMKKHLEDLKRKDYAQAKMEELGLQDIFQADRVPLITTVMFIQTEKMLEIISHADQDLLQKALDSNIHILSPIGLINLLNQAKMHIDYIRQDRNIAQLKTEVKKLIESVTTMFERAEEVGEAISKANKSYNKLVGTFNQRFLTRLTNFAKLGIEMDKKSLPGKLKKIASEGELIEGDLLEIELKIEGDY
jgi:DNA recombination protein RmuC